MPSVRKLSIDLNVSRNTVENAYDLLVSEGYVESRDRRGYFVCSLHRELGRPERSRETGAMSHPDSGPARQSFEFDFHPGRVDDASFPVTLWSKLQAEIFRDSEFSMSFYGDSQGELRLRQAFCEYLRRSRGISCDAQRIVITSGLRDSLTLVCNLLKGRVSTVAIEDPGYHIPYLTFEERFKVRPIPLDEAGLKMEPLRKSKADAVYVTPSHQAPLGMVMSFERRRELVSWARATGAYLIEDDYDAELRYNGLPIPALQGMFPDGNIFYAGSVSKVLSPALRLGYLVIPASLDDTYKHIKETYKTPVSLPVQATLALFLEKGHWDRHILRMRVLYKRKHDLLLSAIEKYLGKSVTITGQGAGLHIILKLKERRSVSELISLARSHGLGLYPLSAGYRASGGFEGLVALGFGKISLSELDRAVALLARVWSHAG